MNSNEHVPMGTAIAIILAVVIGATGLIGGIFFFALSGGNNDSIVTSGNFHNDLVGRWVTDAIPDSANLVVTMEFAEDGSWSALFANDYGDVEANGRQYVFSGNTMVLIYHNDATEIHDNVRIVGDTLYLLGDDRPLRRVSRNVSNQPSPAESTTTEQTDDIPDNNRNIVGSWQRRFDQEFLFMSHTYTFDDDGRFIYMFRLVTDTGGVLNTDGVTGYVLWGTWSIDGDYIIIHLDSQANLNSLGNINTATTARVSDTWHYYIRSVSANQLNVRRGGFASTLRRID